MTTMDRPEVLKRRRDLLEKNGKPLMQLKKTGTCSVCSSKAKKNNPLIKSSLTGASTCLRCLHQINMSGDKPNIPKGAIQCLKCRAIDSFVCHYPDGVKAVFSYSGLSNDAQSIYVVTHTTGKWLKGTTPRNITCGKCNKTIPYWMLEMNRYVRAAHTT